MSDLSSLLRDPPKPLTKSEHALVVAYRKAEAGQVHGAIAFGTRALIEDIREALGSMDADESIGDPPTHGIWIWDGDVVTRTSWDGDIDVEYVGEYRAPTADEMATLTATGCLWPWPADEDDDREDPRQVGY